MAPIDTTLWDNAFQTIPDVSFFDAGKFCLEKILDQNFRFSPFCRGFRGSAAERMSKSACSSKFALDGLLESSVRPKNLGFGKFAVRTSFFSMDAGSHSEYIFS